MPRRWLAEDMLIVARERDRWKRRAERSTALAERAVEKMQEAKEALRAEKARNAASGQGFFVIEGQPNNEGDSHGPSED
jgi:hypothetical protein